MRISIFQVDAYMAVLESEQLLRQLTPDTTALSRIGRPRSNRHGTKQWRITTSSTDISLRPKGIPEDPVTGAAQCMLAPNWAKRIGKNEFHAVQASRRGGEVVCRLINDRIELKGRCVFYLQGEVEH